MIFILQYFNKERFSVCCSGILLH